MARKKGSTDYPLDVKLEAVRLWEEEGVRPQRFRTASNGGFLQY